MTSLLGRKIIVATTLSTLRKSTCLLKWTLSLVI